MLLCDLLVYVIFSNRSPKFEVKDDDGMVLGGKRASIQFAHERSAKARADPELPKPKVSKNLVFIK